MNIEFPFKEPDFIQVWEEWIQYRKERKIAKYVPTGLQKTFTHLKNISGSDKITAIKIIIQSMEQNYSGLFPLKQSNGQPNQGAKTNSRSANASAFFDKAKAEYDAITGGAENL